LPVIMYNIPGRVVINMTPDTIVRLSQIKNIVGVKEANGDMGHVAQVINNARDGFLVWSGNDNDTFPIMAMGGYGVIGVTTHLTGKQYKKMIDLIVADKIHEAAAIHRQLVPLVNALFSIPSPAPIKFALNYIGFKVGSTRLPLVMPTEKEGEKIITEIKRQIIDLKA
jgi:4-hydroxy-tetrahydrodipicolinate synthase